MCKQRVVLKYVDLVPHFQSNDYQDDYAISSVCQFGTKHMNINSISTVCVCQLGTTSSSYGLSDSYYILSQLYIVVILLCLVGTIT